MTVWLAACGTAWRAAVRIVASDPSTTYRRAVQDALLQAPIVADHFHLVRLANDAVTRVQKRSVATNSGGTGGAYRPRVG